VVEVESDTAAQIRNQLSVRNNHTGVGGHIISGPADYGRNYFLPAHPVWHWHFTDIDRVYQLPGALAEVFYGEGSYRPSDIEANPDQWIASNRNHYDPYFYEVKGEIQPDAADALANVSNRGVAGTGERALITGFIVTGGQPRNVVVRGLGPSLSGQGVQAFASNPEIAVFDNAGNRAAANTDWKTDSRADALNASYPALAPTNDNEAALLLTLLPGAYTVQGANEDGTEGVMVIEAYDVDSTGP
jgi:hypothetical protein